MSFTRRVNRALHEARRPLQVLALDPFPPREVAAIEDALDEIDEAVNGKRPSVCRDRPSRESLRLVAAIENLVVNALEHGEGPVEITITPATPGARASITVRNSIRRNTDEPKAITDPRRGHGVSVIERSASGSGGRFALELGGREAVATLALGSGPARRPG
jgi:signal transduction histidine kinase